MASHRVPIESSVCVALDAGDYRRAATLAMELYGSEVYGFLVSHLHDADAASEVYAQFSEVFWRSLPQFRQRCSVRTWAYKLARHEAIRHLKREQRRRCFLTPASRSSCVGPARTPTAPYRRTEVQSRFQRLREALGADDRTLLWLRVDREMSWLAIAQVMLAGTPTSRELHTEAARLRKRFERLRVQLRKAAQQAGILEP